MDNDKLIQNNNTEIWKAIPGWEGLYEVSSIGRVRSLGKYVAYRHGLRWIEGRIRAIMTYRGYNYVNLCRRDNDKKIEKRFLVHRLVAEAFLPNPENKRCVDHLNTIRTDNRVENLRWVTHLENQKNPITAKRLAEPARRVIRLAPDGSTKEYAMLKDVVADGFSQSLVCACCRGSRTVHRGFIWAYKGEKLGSFDEYISEKNERIREGAKKKIRPYIGYNDSEEIEIMGQKDARNRGLNPDSIMYAIRRGRLYNGYYWRYK